MPFATATDVATRLGRSLSATQQAQAEAVIQTVTGLIVDEVDRTEAWATALSPVPKALKVLCVEKAVAVISRPEPAVASESLGVHSVTFAREANTGVYLTDAEARLARLAVYGTNSGSSTPRALMDRLIDLRENRDVDEEPE